MLRQASLGAQLVRNLPAMWKFDPWAGQIPWRGVLQSTPVFLPGKSHWTEEPGGLQFTGSKRVGHDWATKHRTAQVIDLGDERLLIKTNIDSAQNGGQLKLSKEESDSLSAPIYFLWISLFFNWRITALQNRVVFCQTSTPACPTQNSQWSLRNHPC